jgi:hypothetical protein
MAHATISAPLGARTGNSKAKQFGIAIAWAVVSLAVLFVLKYVLFYFRHYDAVSFDPYWPRRGWLFLHINGGALALLMGPWQFWTGLRKKSMIIHRWTHGSRSGMVDYNRDGVRYNSPAASRSA